LIFTQTLGLETISASLSSFVAGFYIVFVLLIRFVITKKLPTTVDIIATLLCLAGLGFLTNSFGQPDPTGIGLTFISAFFVAIHLYVLDKYINKDTAFMLTFLQMIGIMTLCGCVLLCTPQLFQLPTQLLTWIALIVEGVACSSVVSWLAAKAQTKLGAFKVSIIMMLEPVFTTIFAHFGLGEQLSLMSFVGIGMILIAIAVINWRLKVTPKTNH
jgi:drug/metabolite transporter (DMT)-like permease